MGKRWWVILLCFLWAAPHSWVPGQTRLQAAAGDTFTFAVTADMREFAGPGAYDSSQYFRGAIEAIAAHGPGAFMVSPGDIDPPANVMWTITQTLGTGYPWYPVVGNHETETPADMAWLRAFDYGPVNPGPSGCPQTTYSFDYGNAHFVMLNEYCDAAGDTVTDGDIPDHLYNWLVADLQATAQPHTSCSVTSRATPSRTPIMGGCATKPTA
jgi:hypothetical protein